MFMAIIKLSYDHTNINKLYANLIQELPKMWCALNVEHFVGSGSNHARDELSVMTGYCVFSIGQHFD
jgi:hypothetical protein